MALLRTIARGIEPDCYVCGKPIEAEDIVVRKPSDRPPGFPDTFSVGGKGYVWVHDKCSPQKRKGHSGSKRRGR